MLLHRLVPLSLVCAALASACSGPANGPGDTVIARTDAATPHDVPAVHDGGLYDGGLHDGGSPRDGATPHDASTDAARPGCGLVTCASAGANCGPVGDGCNTVLSCGSCTSPATCGGGGHPSRCGGTVGCVPRTCATAGVRCGPASDGCGGLLSCGVCPAGQSCGAGGHPGVCGVPTGAGGCVPRTCATAGASCGPVADGCGGLLACGVCPAGQSCGAAAPSVCSGTVGGPGTCTGLCLLRMACTGGAGATTTISGTVVTPAITSPDPLYNAVVYIPNAPVAPFAPGVSCDRCGALASGSPLVSAVTGPDGRFTLHDVPVGMNIPLVVQLGRWRRQVVIPMVNPCMDNPLPTDLTRLPRNHIEGDIPLMAMVTGSADALECVLRKIGIDDAEFTPPAGGGRVQFYTANGVDAGPATPMDSVLYGDPTALARYDMVLFACEGSPNDKPSAALTNLVNYANVGGRVFATHYSYTWLYSMPPFSSTAMWNVDQSYPPSPLTGFIDTSFPRGVAFSQWLQIVGASTTPGQISITDPRHDVDSVVAPTGRWIYSSSPDTVQHLTFNTPVGVAEASQCGRVLFSDFHVTSTRGHGHRGAQTFPGECDTNPLTPQEKVLEFMLFDLASCVAPDAHPVPVCIPRTCAAAGATCGPIGDGCGGMVNCGVCASGMSCGAGGTPSACGVPRCVPQTCSVQGLQCGPAGDGCGGTIQCGPCPAPLTCGGGGHPGVCGRGPCTPRTCTQANAECGPIADGCGGVVQCGPCPEATACGGGGVANHCGSPG